MMTAVRIYGMVLQFTSQGLRDDEGVVRLTIREEPKARQLKATNKTHHYSSMATFFKPVKTRKPERTNIEM
jgi:hypothetical protein